MPALVVGGVTIPVAVSSPVFTRDEAVDRGRSFDGGYFASQTGGASTDWQFSTPPVTPALAATYKAALGKVESQLCSGDILEQPTMCFAEYTGGKPTRKASGHLVVVDFLLHEATAAAVLFRYSAGDTVAGESFSRATTGTYVTSGGVLASAAINAKRDSHYVGGVRSLLLEGARTNLVVQSDALSTANGWTHGGGVTVTPAYTSWGILDLSRIQGGGDVYRTVTLTGDGVKAVSFVVQYDNAAGNTEHALFDAGGAYRFFVTVTWAGDGTATAVASTGTLLAFELLSASTYRVWGLTTTCIAANVNRIHASHAGGTTSVRLGGVQVEDASFPSSIIPTTTAPVARAADSYSIPFTTPPQEMSMYAKFLELGTARGVSRLFQVSNAADDIPRIMAYTPAAGPYFVYHANASASVGAGLAAGLAIRDAVELMIRLFGDGSVDITQSIAAGTATTATQSAALAMAAAWSGQLLWLNSGGTAGGVGFTAIRSMKIVAGSRSIEEMRTL